MSTRAPLLALQPKAVNLALYAGDGATLRITVTDKAGVPVDLTGAVAAQIKTARGDTSAKAEWLADLSNAALGVVVITLSGEDTAALGDFTGVYDCQWTPAGGEPVTLMQGEVKCAQDVTR